MVDVVDFDTAVFGCTQDEAVQVECPAIRLGVAVEIYPPIGRVKVCDVPVADRQNARKVLAVNGDCKHFPIRCGAKEDGDGFAKEISGR